MGSLNDIQAWSVGGLRVPGPGEETPPGQPHTPPGQHQTDLSQPHLSSLPRGHPLPPLSAGARLVGRGGRLPSQPGQAGTDGSLSGQLRLLLHITVLTIFTTSFPFISILTSTQD